MVKATHDPKENILTLEVAGDLVSTSAEPCAAEIDEWLARHKKKDWIRLDLDLRASRLVDSVGLNVVIGLVKRLQKQKKAVKVFIASPSVKRVFEFSHLSEHVEVHYKKRRFR